MNSTLVLPTEACVTSDVLKRALLNYEKVFLKSPDDRDFVNGSDLMSISTNSPGMSMFNGLAKPLGKEKDYDLKFEKVLDEFKPALDEGSLVVMPVSKDIYNRSLGLGYDIPYIEKFVYFNYRMMIADDKFFKAASAGINRNWLNDNNFEELAPVGADDLLKYANEALNNKKVYSGRVQSEEERSILTRMIHARIASISRNLILCDSNGLAPFTTNIGYSAVINHMQNNFSDLLAEVNDGTLEVDRLDLSGKVEEVIFSDFLNQDKIKNLTVKQTLKLRTKLWGKFNENKSNLDKALLVIASDAKDVEDFRKKVKEQFSKLVKDNRDYLDERGILGVKIAFNFGALASVPSISSILQGFIQASSFQSLMAIACPATFVTLEKRVPEILKVLKQRRELMSVPAYNLFNYHKPLL